MSMRYTSTVYAMYNIDLVLMLNLDFTDKEKRQTDNSENFDITRLSFAATSLITAKEL